MWTPITEVELLDKIHNSQNILTGELKNFWDSIQMIPEKWQEEEFGTEGNGFWIVGIWRQQVIWYNDIEEGFNISTFSKYGKIDEYICNQHDLSAVLIQLHQIINSKA